MDSSNKALQGSNLACEAFSSVSNFAFRFEVNECRTAIPKGDSSSTFSARQKLRAIGLYR